jgi:hypothetical protein
LLATAGREEQGLVKSAFEVAAATVTAAREDFIFLHQQECE